MYTDYDLLKLEELTNAELNAELKLAQERYSYTQSLYENDEDDNNFAPKIPLDIIFMQLKNTEMYIRRIENLLHEYEADRFFVKKAISRRNKRFTRLK